MKRIVIFGAGVLLIAAFVAVIVLNPGEVDFRPTHIHSFRPMLGVLLIVAFSTGAVLALFGGSLRSVSAGLSNWRARRAARQATQAGEWHRSGEQLAWEGEIDRSRMLLKKAWKRQPGNGAAALALASSYMDTGEYAAAHQVLAAAVEQDANDPDVRYALGEALRRRGEHGEAIRMLETVRVQHPRAPRVLISLRELYRETRRWKEAADVQAIYLQTLPTEAQAGERERLVQFRYQAALALPDVDARVAALDAVVQSDRAFVPALVSLGDALLQQGRADEAQKLWEKAFKSHPRLVFVERLIAHDGGVTPHRGVTLLGKYREQLDADSTHLLQARVALADGDLERASSELTAVSKQDNPTVQRTWAEILHRRGQHEEAWTAICNAADHLGAAAGDHHCIVCGRFSEMWLGYCEGCDGWDTYRSGAELGTPKA